MMNDKKSGDVVDSTRAARAIADKRRGEPLVPYGLKATTPTWPPCPTEEECRQPSRFALACAMALKEAWPT